MNNPGDYSLADLAITTALTSVTQSPIQNLEGVLSGLTPVATAIAPSDGAMPDNTVQDGILGSAMRVKITSTGTYANTVLSVKISAR